MSADNYMYVYPTPSKPPEYAVEMRFDSGDYEADWIEYAKPDKNRHVFTLLSEAITYAHNEGCDTEYGVSYSDLLEFPAYGDLVRFWEYHRKPDIKSLLVENAE